MTKLTFYKYTILLLLFGGLFFSSAVIAQSDVVIDKVLTDKITADGDIKAGFIYVGPVGDYGWTNAHDYAKNITETKYSWLTTEKLETVPEDIASVVAAVDTLVVTKGCNVIFTTSFGFMDGTVSAAEKYPNVLFFHCSGYKRGANMGTYFADFYPLYYLNGLMAGALTESGKLGYVGAFPIPEVNRHINAFAIGAQEVNATATVDVRWINSWYDPTLADNAANALIADGVDMLAFTEDSPAVMQAAEKEAGVYAFSHYSPMQSYAPTSTISGQLAHWEVLYDELLLKVHDGTYNNTNLANVDPLYFIHEGAVELGGQFDQAINPLFVDDLKGITTTDTVHGELSVYDLIMTRIDEMNHSWADFEFDPFTGPISANNGTEMFAAGHRATIPEMFSSMDWYVDGVIEGSSSTAPVDQLGVLFGLFAVATVEIIRRRKKK